MHVRARRGLLGLFLFAGTAGGVVAQEVPPSAPETAAKTAANPANAGEAVLSRIVSLHLSKATLATALHALQDQAHLQLIYSPDEVPLETLVTLDNDRISVGDALRTLLAGTGLGFVTNASGWVTLRPAHSTPAILQQGTASISGYVRDSATGAAIPQATVRVDGATIETKSNASGGYQLTGLAAGEYRVIVRRVGYVAKTRTITVSDGQAVTLTFGLTPPATRLDEVVTTALGEQRRYQIGNTIAAINVDSIAPTAPVTSLTDLISGRAPGVTVLETSGLTGAGEAIRIRGLSSITLQNDPILIVDGVRQDNSAGGDISAYFRNVGTHPSPARINDIDFSDIETIDVLKGPSASTEYGTDAANGVIVITTKHGAAGRPEWKASAEQTQSDVPTHFPNGDYSWGHATNGAGTTGDCALLPIAAGAYASSGPPYNFGSTFGACVVDSVTQWNPFNHQATSLFGTGDRRRYDLSVSGGSDAVRYFISGGLSNETGIVKMPPVFRELADTAGLGLPNAVFNSNSEQQRSVRITSAIRLNSTTDLTVTASYLSTYQQTPDSYTLLGDVVSSLALDDAAHYYGYDDYDVYGGSSQNSTPISTLSVIGSQITDAVTGGLTGNWRPTGWLVGHATVGLDHGAQRDQELNYPLANPAYMFWPPFLGLSDPTSDLYSLDLRGTATAVVTQGIRAVTSVGLQVVDSRTVGQSASTSNITLTNLTLDGATQSTVTQEAQRQATVGGYGEEELSFADRLFLTGAVRIDAGSGFGQSYSTATYPKASVSWLAIPQGVATVRLRGAFGESGVQPPNGAALILSSPGVVYLGNGQVSATTINWPGNPNLRPERSEEFEGGVDVSGWQNRVSLELTAYEKTTHDALVNQTLGGDLCCYSYEQNIGEVQNTGVEGTVDLGVIETRSVTWNIVANVSTNHNTLVALAPGIVAQSVSNLVMTERQQLGYPLYGIWARPLAYQDRNRDGIIEPGELTLADSEKYVGPSLPTQETSIATHLGFWQGSLTVGGLVDYRGGYRISNGSAAQADGFCVCTQAVNNPNSSPWLQARSIENAQEVYTALDAEDGSFIRFRELSLTYNVPRRVARTLGIGSASISAAVRNLALWTRYTGGYPTGADPEVTNTGGSNVQSSIGGGNVVNSDVRADYGSVPLARYWVVRLNVGIM